MMTGELALLASIVSIAFAIWFFLHSRSTEKRKHDVCDKIRKLQKLERAVKSLAKEMKDV